MGEKKFLEVKSLFFVMHVGGIFVKIKVAFVAESFTQLGKTFKYILPHYNWMIGLTLPQNPKECWQIQARKQWGKKLGALWNVVVVGLLLSSQRIIIYDSFYHTSISTAS